MNTEYGLYRSAERLAEQAHQVCLDVREEDGRAVLNRLAASCLSEPLKAAQIIMALAAWVDVDEPLSERGARVLAISEPRLGV